MISGWNVKAYGLRATQDRGTTSQSHSSVHWGRSKASIQSISKYVARMALGMSNSVSGMRLERENIRIIRDVVHTSYSAGQTVPDGMLMTDGCGFSK